VPGASRCSSRSRASPAEATAGVVGWGA
jgi:hypothetical protein